MGGGEGCATPGLLTQPQPDESADRGRALRAAFAAGVAQMVSPAGIMNGAYGAFLIPVTAAFGWSRTQFSLGVLIQAWTMALIFPYSGRLIDRIGPRAIVLPCTVALGIAFFLLSQQQGSLTYYYFAMSLIGLCAAMSGPVPANKVIATWFDRRRGTAMALAGTGLALAAALLPPSVQHIIAAGGWRAAFQALAAFVLLFGLPILFAFFHTSGKRLGGSQTSGPQDPGDSAAPAHPFRSRAFFTILVGCAGTTLVSSAILNHAFAILNERHIAGSQAAGFVVLVAIGMGVCRLVEGFILDRLDSPKIGAAFCALALCGVITLHNAGNMTTVYLAAVLFGVGIGSEVTLIPFAISRAFGVARMAQIYGVVWAVSALLAGAGPALVANLFDRTGSYASGLMVIEVVLVVAIASFLAAPAYAFRSTHRKSA